MSSLNGTKANDTLVGTDLDDSMRGRAGDDVLRGENGNDVLRGNRGQDTLYGGEGNDRLLGGADDDTLFGENGNDRLNGGSGNDVLDGGAGKDKLNGGIGNDVLDGRAGNDRLNGGKGNDHLYGGEGSDTYIYRFGDGDDVIADDSTDHTDKDRLVFKDLNASDVRLMRFDQEDHIRNYLFIEIRDPVNERSNFIEVGGQFDTNFPGLGIEEIRFADGTIWNRQFIEEMTNHYEGTDQDDELEGTELSESFNGGMGDDFIYGDSGDDQITGGLGDDTLIGGEGSDTFYYSSGDGSDRIYEEDERAYEDVDRLVFTDLNASDLEFIRVEYNGYYGDTDHQTLLIAAPETGNWIEIENQFGTDWPSNAIEEIEFADGTVWNAEAIAKNVWYQGTNDDDRFYGTFQSETFQGARGHDQLFGHSGSDTYIFSEGDGYDEIFESDFNWTEEDNLDVDRLVFTDLNASDVFLRQFNVEDPYFSATNLFIEVAHIRGREDSSILVWDQFNGTNNGSGIEEIEFADGTIWDRAAITFNTNRYAGTDQDDTLAGSEASELFIGGAGNDDMLGGLGSDTFQYALGDGSDVIVADDYYDSPSSNQDTDRFVFVDLSSDQVRLIQQDQDLFLQITQDSELIQIIGQFDENTPSNGIEELVFSDGQVWDRTAIEDNLFTWEPEIL